MFKFLLVAAVLCTYGRGRYDGQHMLHEYFWDDNLWDTVTRHHQLTQKCINDRKWDQLCLCHSNHRRNDYFMCASEARYNRLLTSGAHANYLNGNGGEYYYYYFPGSKAAQNSFQFALPPLPEMSNPWKAPYGDLGKHEPPLHVAHVISKEVLIDFYNAVFQEFGPTYKGGGVMKSILEPLFDAIKAKLVC